MTSMAAFSAIDGGEKAETLGFFVLLAEMS